MWKRERIQQRAGDKIKGLKDGTSRPARQRVGYLLQQRWRGYGEEFPGTSSPLAGGNFAGAKAGELIESLPTRQKGAHHYLAAKIYTQV